MNQDKINIIKNAIESSRKSKDSQIIFKHVADGRYYFISNKKSNNVDPLGYVVWVNKSETEYYPMYIQFNKQTAYRMTYKDFLSASMDYNESIGIKGVPYYLRNPYVRVEIENKVNITGDLSVTDFKVLAEWQLHIRELLKP